MGQISPRMARAIDAYLSGKPEGASVGGYTPVEDFGFVGDGSAGDVARLQAAVDATLAPLRLHRGAVEEHSMAFAWRNCTNTKTNQANAYSYVEAGFW